MSDFIIARIWNKMKRTKKSLIILLSALAIITTATTGFMQIILTYQCRENSYASGSVPELYPNIQWNSTELEEVGFLSRSGGKPVYLNSHRIDSKILESYPNEFFDYYKRELRARGWKEVVHTKGSDAELCEYEANGRYIVFRAHKVSREQPKYQAVVELSLP
jgi:hypothetical protein